MNLEDVKQAIKNKSCIDFHYKDDNSKQWHWMIIVSLSDDESTLYYKINGMGYPLATTLENIFIDKIR